MKNGSAGTIALSQFLQQHLTPPGSSSVTHGDLRFSPGDRLIHPKNNYDFDVFNGTMGVCEITDPRARTLAVRYDEKTAQYKTESLDELGSAYAITVHKSPGQEYPMVILPIQDEPDLRSVQIVPAPLAAQSTAPHQVTVHARILNRTKV